MLEPAEDVDGEESDEADTAEIEVGEGSESGFAQEELDEESMGATRERYVT